MGCITSRDRWPPWPKKGRDVIEEVEVTVITPKGNKITVKKPICTTERVWPGMLSGGGGGGNERVDANYMCNDASAAQENSIRAMEDNGG